MGITRRRFLGGDFAAARIVLRPPWALHEAAFLKRCARCDACLDVRPAAILAPGSGRYPEIDFTAMRQRVAHSILKDELMDTSVVLWAWPAKSASVRSRLASLPGVRIHTYYNGRFVLTIEDTPGQSTADALLKLHDLDGVMNASLVYRSADDAARAADPMIG